MCERPGIDLRAGTEELPWSRTASSCDGGGFGALVEQERGASVQKVHNVARRPAGHRAAALPGPDTPMRDGHRAANTAGEVVIAYAILWSAVPNE